MPLCQANYVTNPRVLQTSQCVNINYQSHNKTRASDISKAPYGGRTCVGMCSRATELVASTAKAKESSNSIT